MSRCTDRIHTPRCGRKILRSSTIGTKSGSASRTHGTRSRGREVMKSSVGKHSIVVAGHKTSISLEEAFWIGLKEISGHRDMTLSELVDEINGHRQQGNLSSAIRLFVLDYFKSRVADIASDSRPHQAAH